jgi:hypothetical protein
MEMEMIDAREMTLSRRELLAASKSHVLVEQL